MCFDWKKAVRMPIPNLWTVDQEVQKEEKVS
jgi:hypothetical protein